MERSLLMLALCLISSCHQIEESQMNVSSDLVDNSENIEKIILSLDATLEGFLSSSLEEKAIGERFLNEAKARGVEFIHLETYMERARVVNASSNLSKEFIHYANDISNPFLHKSESDYIRRLNQVSHQVKNSSLAIAEKQVLVDNLMFMESLVGWMDGVDRKYNSPGEVNTLCSGWWSCWGRCAAGTVGGALLGGITGCGVGGGVGAAVGSVIPGAGTATGAISGCAAIGLAGVIGGGLSGAAEYCP